MSYFLISYQKQIWLKFRPFGLGLLLALFSSMAIAGVTARDLKVVQEAAQEGMWSISYAPVKGRDGKERIIPGATACQTREQIFAIFANPLSSNSQTGEENCPSSIVKNLNDHGIVRQTCSGAKSPLINIPDEIIDYEIKKIGTNQWEITGYGMKSFANFHGHSKCGN
jgi:hypothetical protein